MSAELDLLDRRILFELDCNSRRSLSEIARKVRLGRDLVSYRIERLQDIGVLRGASAMINPYKLGLTVYKTYLKLQGNKERWNELIDRLDKHPSSAWLAECYGKCDLIWCLHAYTPKEVYDIQNEMFSEFRDIITSSSVSTMVNYWWFPKKYLIGCSSKEVSGWNFELPQFTFGTTPDEYVLDDIESGLLRLLCQNARLSFTELAERLNTTPAIVKYRLQKLEKSGLLAGYRIDVDRSKLGMTLFKVQLHPKTFSTEDQQAFHDYCRKHPQISEYVQQLGDCKIEFIVEALDYAQFNELIDSMRSEFSHYIQNLEYMMVKQDYFHRTPSNSFIDRACMPKTEKRLGGEPRKIAA